MNARQANQVSIRNYLSSIGISPVSSNKRSSLYLAPYREDKHPSLKVSHQENLWVDYGNDNKGGTLIDLVLKLHPHYNVSDAIKAIEKSTQSFFSFHQQETLSNPDPNSKQQMANGKKPTANDQQQIAISQKPITNNKKPKADSRICIYKIRPLGNHPAINNYITSRGIQLETAKPYISEIYFTVNGQTYFGIGNKNDSGWSIRNKYWKGCTAQGYSHYINAGSDRQSLAVFEGIFDLLSYLELRSQKVKAGDFLVLNSLVNLKKASSILVAYKTINLYLDHDEAGRKATQHIMHQFPGTRDGSGFYSSFKDLNEYHLKKVKACLPQGKRRRTFKKG
jgi:hypothetical protein